MLVTLRFRGAGLGEELVALADLLAARPGCLGTEVGRNLDDPDLWTLVLRWHDVGSYRRALGSHEVKLHGTPTLLKTLDEPSAWELFTPGHPMNDARTRAVDRGWIG